MNNDNEQTKEESLFYFDSDFIFRPIRLGNSTLVYGKRVAFWPFHCHVGPQWRTVAYVFCIILAVNITILVFVSKLGAIVTCIGVFGFCALLLAYASVSFTDPGTVYIYKHAELCTESNSLPIYVVNEASLKITCQSQLSSANILLNSEFPTVQNIDCNQCNIIRPSSATHCSTCNHCVNKLDHHCPWCGKCIGGNNFIFFIFFIITLLFQVLFLIISTFYYIFTYNVM